MAAMESMEVAETVVEAYAGEGDVAAVLVAGSLGRGLADAHSDIEVDVYWREPPSPDRRELAVRACGGTEVTLWPFAPAEGEWSEDFEVGGHCVTVSGFTTGWLDQVITRRADFVLLDQLRLAALHEGQPLVGVELVQRWRTASVYPAALRRATVAHYREGAPLHSWRQWPALVERGDLVPLHGLCADLTVAVLGMLCGLNGIYVSHPRFKWAEHTARRFHRAPMGLAERLDIALRGPMPATASALDDLVRETLALVEQPD